MSNLLNTEEGRNALHVAQKYQLERRLSRYFHRTIVIDFDSYQNGSEFNLSTMLGSLNPSIDSEILEIYRLLGAIGGLSSTISEMTYYVSSTGSDITGTGSATNPYSTLWFIDNLPRRINHPVRIVLQSSISIPNYNMVLDFSFGNEGSFAIIGQGNPIVSQSNAIVSLNPSTNGSAAIVEGAVPWANPENAFIIANKYAAPVHTQFAAFNEMLAIQSNQFAFGSVAPGMTAYIAVPAITLTVNSIRSMCFGSSKNAHSQIALVNMNISFTPYVGVFHNDSEDKLVWENKCESTLSFVRFTNWLPNGYIPGIKISGSINNNVLLDRTDVLNLAQCPNVDNIDGPDVSVSAYEPSLCGVKFDGSGGASYNRILLKNAQITSLDCHVNVLAESTVQINNSCVGILYVKNTIAEVYGLICDGAVTPGPAVVYKRAGIDAYNSRMLLENVDVLLSDNVITVNGNVDAIVSYVGSDVTYSQISNGGMWCFGANRVDLRYTNPGVTPLNSGNVGTVGQVILYLQTIGEAAYNWPPFEATSTYGRTIVSWNQ